MSFHQLLRILRARAAIAVTITVLTVLVALAVSLVLPKNYTANTSVVIDVKSPDPVAGVVLPGMISPGYMATQVDIVNSGRVAERVVEQLRLADDPDWRAKWQEANDGVGDFKVWLAAQLQKKLDVKPARESNVIDIAFSGRDPEFVARVANAFAQAYIDVNIDLKVEPARRNANWFSDQTQVVRERLERAQRTYSDYQQEAGIVATDERFDFETNRLNELSSQLSVVEGETTDSHSRSLAARNGTLPEVMQSPLINELKADVARLESRLQDSNVNLGRNHPQTQRSESELASLKARLASETAKIVGSVSTSYEVGKQKAKELRAAIEAQKTRLLSLNKQRDELAVRKREVESAQRAFDDVSLRAAQTRLESLSVMTNMVVLNQAAVPTVPSSPKTKVNLLIATILGLILGVGFGLVQELANRRVRSAADLAELSGLIELPLLAAIPHVRPAAFARQAPRRLFGPRRRLSANPAL